MTDETTKEAIDSLKRAQANMRAVLERNSTIENQLRIAVELCERLIKYHVSGEALVKEYGSDAKLAKDVFNAKLNTIRSYLP